MAPPPGREYGGPDGMRSSPVLSGRPPPGPFRASRGGAAPTERRPFAARKAVAMLGTVIIILLVLWLLGIVTSTTMGGLLHLLLVVALVVIIVRLVSGRKVIA